MIYWHISYCLAALNVINYRQRIGFLDLVFCSFLWEYLVLCSHSRKIWLFQIKAHAYCARRRCSRIHLGVLSSHVPVRPISLFLIFLFLPVFVCISFFFWSEIHEPWLKFWWLDWINSLFLSELDNLYNMITQELQQDSKNFFVGIYFLGINSHKSAILYFFSFLDLCHLLLPLLLRASTDLIFS